MEMSSLNTQNPYQLGNRGRIQRKTWCTGPYARVDYNLTFCLLQSRIWEWATLWESRPEPYARLDFFPAVWYLVFGLYGRGGGGGGLLLQFSPFPPFSTAEPVFVDVYGHLGIDSKNRFHLKNWF